jgi:ribosomal protein L21E
MIVHILLMYNSKHPHTWDESLPYVQHSYNQALYSSTSHNPFQVGLGFQPLGPIHVALPLAVTSTDSSPAPTKDDKATWFIERIQHIHQQVRDILQKSNDNYKKCHDQHRVPHKFQVGDKVWLHLQKSCVRGPHRKFQPLCYGLYTITKAVGDNSFELNIPPFLGLHMVFNVDLLRPYFPPLLDTSDVAEQLTPTELNPKYIQQASNDHIVDTHIKGTRQQRIHLYRVVKVGRLLHQGKWLTRGQFQ